MPAPSSVSTPYTLTLNVSVLYVSLTSEPLLTVGLHTYVRTYDTYICVVSFSLGFSANNNSF